MIFLEGIFDSQVAQVLRQRRLRVFLHNFGKNGFLSIGSLFRMSCRFKVRIEEQLFFLDDLFHSLKEMTVGFDRCFFCFLFSCVKEVSFSRFLFSVRNPVQY